MAKSNKGCIDAALETLSLFTDSELSGYVKEVFSKAKSYTDVHGAAAIDRAMKEVNDSTTAALFEDTQFKVNDMLKTNRLANEMKFNKKSLRELLIKRYKGLGTNVEGAQKGAKARLESVIYPELDKEEFDYLTNKNNAMDIVLALDNKKSSPISDKIAGFINQYILKRTDEMVTSNALPLEYINGDRFFRNTHNASKIMNAGISLVNRALDKSIRYTPIQAKQLWKTFIKDKLDLLKTFEHTEAVGDDGQIIHAEVDKILDDIFDNITTDKSSVFAGSKVVNDLEAILKKRRMFFQFKDWENFYRYNEKYGTGDFFSALQMDINASANKIGVAELLGSSPVKAYSDLRKVQFDLIGNKGARMTDLYFKEVMGIDKTAVNSKLATFTSNALSLSAMSSLWKVGVLSTPDIAYMASFAARWGVSYWKTYGYALSHLFDTFKTEDRQYIAKLFKGMINDHIGYVGRFVDSNNTNEIMKKAGMLYYKTIGLNALDRGNKISIMHVMADHLANMSDKSWEGLNENLQTQLTKHDIKNYEWNILRQKNQRKLFTPDNVNKLSDSELHDIYNKSDKSVPLYQLRNDIYRKVYSLFDIASENAVLTPGAFERAWLFQGQTPNGPVGAALRLIGQYKAYPLAYIDRVLVNGFRNAEGTNAKVGWALQMFLATAPLSVLSNYLSYLSSGLSYPNPADMSTSELIKFGLENIEPNLGVFMNIMDARNQNSSLIAAQINTPAVQLLSNALATPLALITGHPKQAEKAFKKASSYILPIRTLPVLSPYLMGMLGQKPYLQPGQTQLYGR